MFAYGTEARHFNLAYVPLNYRKLSFSQLGGGGMQYLGLRLKFLSWSLNMYLVRSTYVSTIGEGFSLEDIENILETAVKHNKINKVTGVLCFSKCLFLQCLEGSRKSVNQTLQKIMADSRHHDFTLLDYREIAEREFDEWSMGYVPESSLTAAVNLKYSADGEFNPYGMSSNTINQFMMTLKNTVPTINGERTH